MSLPFGGGQQDGPGIYVNEGKIIGVRDVSGKKLNDYATEVCDIGINVKLDIGKDFQPVLSFGGKFDKKEGVITGWGKAIGLKIFLSNMGLIGELDINNRVPEATLKLLVGQTVYRLSYMKGLKEKDGKTVPAYGTWNKVMPVATTTKEMMVKAFMDSVKKGYPANYKPDATKDIPVTFDEPQSTPVTAQALKDDDENEWS